MRLAACTLFAVLAAAQEPAAEIKPLLDSAAASHMKGDYEGSRQSLLKAWDLAQQTPATEPIRYDILKRLTSIRAAAGEFADADNYLQMAINWRENTNGRDDPKIADDLLVSFSLCRGMKNYDRAHFILQRVMALQWVRQPARHLEVQPSAFAHASAPCIPWPTIVLSVRQTTRWRP